MHNGATDAINYKTQDFATVIKDKTGGKGVDVVVDFIGQNYFKRCAILSYKRGVAYLNETLHSWNYSIGLRFIGFAEA